MSRLCSTLRTSVNRWGLAVLALCAGIAGGLIAAEKSSSAMATAATRFLEGLTPEARQQATFAFDSDERLNWHYVPRQRKGLPFKAMTEPQRSLARGLLKTGLSQPGYLTAAAIIDLETILGDLERATGGRIARDPELYYFSIFGTPSTKETWGWRVEGHHLSLNFTVVRGTLVASTPSFFGTNPAEVKDGPQKGLRILADREDAGRALLLSLDPQQRTKATIADASPNEIVTANTVKVDPLSPVGIQASELTSRQRDLLMRLIDVYASAMTSDVASDRLTKLRRAGTDKITFAWAGQTQHGQPHYYRIQGPTFLVEYDNTQNNANHIHSVWRDFDGDFGRDLLREHVKSVPH